jgi:signal transduction histidine kinase
MAAIPNLATTLLTDIPRSREATRAVRTWRVRVLGLAALFFVGLLDYHTGDEVSFAIFYIPVIAYVAWSAGVRSAMTMVILGTSVWLWVDLNTHGPFTQAWIPWWNATGRCAIMVGVVVSARLVRRHHARLRVVVARRTHELQMEAAQRSALEREMQEITAREQARIARDLHDGVGQYISGLAFRVHLLTEDLERENSPHAASARRLLDIIGAANREMRRMNRKVQSRGATEDLGVALRRMAGDLRQLFDIACEVDLPETPVELDASKADALYRIAQEALNNAIKHGGAARLLVSLAPTATGWKLTISDRGTGLPPEAAFGEGAGLKIMQYRAELIGARLTIANAAHGGCAVECHVEAGVPGRPRGERVRA